MKVLTTLLVIALVIMGLCLLAPVFAVGAALLGGGIFLIVWLIPLWIIATSDHTTGGEKAAWLLAIIFLSWFAWVFYFFLAPIKPKRRRRDYDRYDYHYED